MSSNTFSFLIISALIGIIIDFVTSIEVTSDPVKVEKIYELNRIYRSLIDDPWQNPICDANMKQKMFICQQILETMELKINKDTNFTENEWKCEWKYVRTSFVHIHNRLQEWILKCPVKQNETDDSYHISFCKYKGLVKSSGMMEAYGFITNTSHLIIHKHFKDVKFSSDLS